MSTDAEPLSVADNPRPGNYVVSWPTEPEPPSAPPNERSLRRYERIAAAAMAEANAAIADTALRISREVAQAQIVRAAADAEGAEAIAERVDQAAEAFNLRRDVSAMRVAFLASQQADAVAAQVPDGDEMLAEATATVIADLVALDVRRQAEEDDLVASEKSAAATAMAVEVAQAAEIAVTAIALTGLKQATAIGEIALETSIQVALDEVSMPIRQAATAPPA